MDSLEIQFNEPDSDSKIIEKYSKQSKKIILILIIPIIQIDK